jgi:hypothetical protein
MVGINYDCTITAFLLRCHAAVSCWPFNTCLQSVWYVAAPKHTLAAIDVHSLLSITFRPLLQSVQSTFAYQPHHMLHPPLEPSPVEH